MYGTMWWFGGRARHTSGVSKDFSIGIVKKNDLEIKLSLLGCHQVSIFKLIILMSIPVFSELLAGLHNEWKSLCKTKN